MYGIEWIIKALRFPIKIKGLRVWSFCYKKDWSVLETITERWTLTFSYFLILHTHRFAGTCQHDTRAWDPNHSSDGPHHVCSPCSKAGRIQPYRLPTPAWSLDHWPLVILLLHMWSHLVSGSSSFFSD